MVDDDKPQAHHCWHCLLFSKCLVLWALCHLQWLGLTHGAVCHSRQTLYLPVGSEISVIGRYWFSWWVWKKHLILAVSFKIRIPECCNSKQLFCKLIFSVLSLSFHVKSIQCTFAIPFHTCTLYRRQNLNKLIRTPDLRTPQFNCRDTTVMVWLNRCILQIQNCISRNFRKVFIFASEHKIAKLKTCENNLLQ